MWVRGTHVVVVTQVRKAACIMEGLEITSMSNMIRGCSGSPKPSSTSEDVCTGGGIVGQSLVSYRIVSYPILSAMQTNPTAEP